MNIRPARPEDQREINNIRSQYDSDTSWQLERRDDGNEVVITFRPVRLPRSFRSEPPLKPPEVPDALREHEYIIVAEETGGEILGYLRAEADPERGSGWVSHLVVVPHHRRNQVGYTLLEQAKRWGTLNNLHRLLVEVETRNAPAIRFLQRCGFTLCGYNESLYRSKDIVLYFSVGLG